MTVYMALDVGDATIGVAVSDPSGALAFPVTTIRRRDKDADVERIVDLMRERKVDQVVVGLPLAIDGTEGPQAKTVRRFAAHFRKKTGDKVVFVDERFTTKMAERALHEMDVKGGKKKGYEDALAASFLLETFLRREMGNTADA